MLNFRARDFLGTDELRSERRFRTGLTVRVNTPQDDQTGVILEISRKGLKLKGIKTPRRARVCVTYQGHSVSGTVRWIRPGDVIGIALDEPLRTGPLALVWNRYFRNTEAFGKVPRRMSTGFGRKVG